jgi:hypothetical protein
VGKLKLRDALFHASSPHVCCINHWRTCGHENL